jgi:hypothetical protein
MKEAAAEENENHRTHFDSFLKSGSGTGMAEEWEPRIMNVSQTKYKVLGSVEEKGPRSRSMEGSLALWK